MNKEINGSNYCYRFINNDTVNGILSCGFLSKPLNSDLLTNCKNDYYSCSVLLNGKGTFIDSHGNSYPITPNFVFQCFPGQKFSIIFDNNSDWSEFNIKIGKSIFQSLASLNLLNTNTPVFQINLKPYLTQWFSELVNQLRHTENVELPEVLFVTQKLLINLHKEDISKYEDDIDSIITASKQLLFYKQNENISLKEIASSFNISYEKFRKIFKEKVGMSPIQYRLQTKFYLAQRLLNDGLPIKVVAEEVGYTDPFTFSRQFTKYIGLPPSKFKPK